jgi:hypothetical protein
VYTHSTLMAESRNFLQWCKMFPKAFQRLLKDFGRKSDMSPSLNDTQNTGCAENQKNVIYMYINKPSRECNVTTFSEKYSKSTSGNDLTNGHRLGVIVTFT